MPEILAEAILRFTKEETGFDRSILQARAREFSEERFLETLSRAILQSREY
jgi:hypothetical protein